MTNLSNGSLLGGRWRIESLVGEGACAKVYSVKGYDCSHEFSLVAKVIPKGTGKGKKQKDQDRLCDTLYYEYTLYTGCMIEFPYLPARPEKFYGFDEVAGVRYLVMERLEADLYALCTRGPKLSTRDIAKWGIQILNGLKWIHNLGFVFVDVKPENFMIKEDKLFFIDFGLVERIQSSPAVGAHAVVGTPTYKGLSAQRGNSPSKRDDIEGMGYVLLAMARQGTLPWSTATSEAQLLQMKETSDIVGLCTEHDCKEVAEIILECRKSGPLLPAAYNSFMDLLAQMRDRPPLLEAQSTALKRPNSKQSSRRTVGDSSTSSQVIAETEGNNSKLKFSTTSSHRQDAASPARKAAAVKEIGDEKELLSATSSSFSGPGRKRHKAIAVDDDDEEGGEEKENNPACHTPVLTVEEGFTAGESFKRTRQAKLSSASATAASMATVHAKVNDKCKSKSHNSNPHPVAKGTFSFRLLSGPIPAGKTIDFQLDYMTDGEKTMGRHESCDFHVPNDFVSECHADFKVFNQKLSIHDNASSNGTRINGVRITPKMWIELTHGDEIKVGQCQIQVIKS